MPDDQRSHYCVPRVQTDKLWKCFQEAEQQIKVLERDEGDGLDIPSINQLRYVAHHLLKALIKDTGTAEIDKAINHAQRSLFDAHEAHSIGVLSSINKFMVDYQLVNVPVVLPKYIAIKKEIIELKSLIKSFPRGDERTDYYQQSASANKRLQEIRDELEAARDSLNVLIEEKRTTTKRWALGLSATIIIALISVYLKK